MELEALSHPFDQLLEIDRRGRSHLLPPAAVTAPPVMIRGVGARLAIWRLLFPLEEVAEIIPVARITRVPGVKSWLIGITHQRGTVISIINLQDFINGQPTTLNFRSRIIVVRSGDWGYGLLVDEIIGMRHFDIQSQQTTQDLDPGVSPYCTGIFHDEEQRWLLFNATRLLRSPQFLDAAN